MKKMRNNHKSIAKQGEAGLALRAGSIPPSPSLGTFSGGIVQGLEDGAGAENSASHSRKSK